MLPLWASKTMKEFVSVSEDTSHVVTDRNGCRKRIRYVLPISGCIAGTSVPPSAACPWSPHHPRAVLGSSHGCADPTERERHLCGVLTCILLKLEMKLNVFSYIPAAQVRATCPVTTLQIYSLQFSFLLQSVNF